MAAVPLHPLRVQSGTHGTILQYLLQVRKGFDDGDLPVVVEATGGPRALPFIMPDEDTPKVTEKPLRAFIVAVDAVEQRTGLIFMR